MTTTTFAGPGCQSERSGRLTGTQLEGPAPAQPASLVATLLLHHPVSLPHWPGQVHRIETPEDAEPFADMPDLIQRTIKTRLENVETVFAEVAAGTTTINAAIRKTGLGKKVVQRAMVALEKDGRIVRVRAKAANYSHQFHIKQSDNGQLTGAEPVGESSGSAQGYRGSI